MPSIQGVTSVAAGATNNNVLSGSIYEYAPFNCVVRFGIVGDAAGELRCTVTTGQDVVLEESPISRQNRFPIMPDDFTLRDVVRAGERIVIKARNTGAGANNLFWNMDITPLRAR